MITSPWPNLHGCMRSPVGYGRRCGASGKRTVYTQKAMLKLQILDEAAPHLSFVYVAGLLSQVPDCRVLARLDITF